MRSLFTRLLAGGAAYQASSVLSAVLALVTLPLYTRALTRADFGVAETLLTFIILASILLRFGLGEAFVRFYFQTPEDERDRLARTTTATVLLVTTLVALLAAVLAGPLSELLLGFEDAGLMRIAVLGLWAFTNLEIAYALLRVEERRRAYVVASLCNVAADRRADGDARRRARRRRARLPRRQLRRLGGRAARAVVAAARTDRAAAGDGRSARCWASACRPCPPTRRCSRSTSSTAPTSCARRAPPRRACSRCR